MVGSDFDDLVSSEPTFGRKSKDHLPQRVVDDLEQHGVLVSRIRTALPSSESVDPGELAGFPVGEPVTTEDSLPVGVEPEHPVGPGDRRLRVVVGLPDECGLGIIERRSDGGLDPEVLLAELLIDTLVQQVLGGRRRIGTVSGLNVVVAVAYWFCGISTVVGRWFSISLQPVAWVLFLQ